MAKNLINTLAPHERLFLFVLLAGNGLFWVGIMATICWLAGWRAPFWAYGLIWGGFTYFGLALLGKIHDAKMESGEIEE